VIRLDAATVMLQWATGGLFFLWVTTRGRLVGLGYGWLMRGVYATIAMIGLVLANATKVIAARDIPAAGLVAAALVALVVSVMRKQAGVSAQREVVERKTARVEAMASAAKQGAVKQGAVKQGALKQGTAEAGELASASIQMRDQFGRVEVDVEKTIGDGPEFPPALDLIAPAIGIMGVVFAALDAHGSAPAWLSVARFVVGAAFLGAVSDAMLLGHWYLVQPGLSRRPIHELNDWLLRIWPVEVALLLIPTGMFSALSGSVKDGWGGMLTWFWFACAVATGILAFVTRLALKERFYSAVMAATGFLYLAILMAFCTDLVGRAILS
jgi:hypothetical protein